MQYEVMHYEKFNCNTREKLDKSENHRRVDTALPSPGAQLPSAGELEAAG
jgi:hypothetical protein